MPRRSEPILPNPLAILDRPAIVRTAFLLALVIWIPRLTAIVRRDAATPALLIPPTSHGVPHLANRRPGTDRARRAADSSLLESPTGEGAALLRVAGERCDDCLQAIVINATTREAVIAGQVVRSGDPVAWNGTAWIVASIEPKCVVLRDVGGARQVALILTADLWAADDATPRRPVDLMHGDPLRIPRRLATDSDGRGTTGRTLR